jgi:hypothetical protein
MTNPERELTITEAFILLTHYNFEIAGYTVEDLIEKWLTNYEHSWIRLAVIEALYQGRYKAISVEQILNFWQKKTTPTYHFTGEFERLICKNVTNFLKSSSDNYKEETDFNNDFYENSLMLEKSNPENNNQFEFNLIQQKEEVSYINIINNQDSNDIIFLDQNQEEETLLDFIEKKDNSSALTIIYYPLNHQPIDQFVPPLDSSQFFLRLKEFIDLDMELIEKSDS